MISQEHLDILFRKGRSWTAKPNLRAGTEYFLKPNLKATHRNTLSAYRQKEKINVFVVRVYADGSQYIYNRYTKDQTKIGKGSEIKFFKYEEILDARITNS